MLKQNVLFFWWSCSACTLYESLCWGVCQDMLALEGSQEQEHVGMIEEDLLMLFEALHRLCDPHMPFHVRNKDAELPVARVEEYAHEFAVPSCPVSAQRGSPSDSSTSAEEIPAPEHLWLANLLNAFGAKKGFDLVCKVCVQTNRLQMPSHVGRGWGWLFLKEGGCLTIDICAGIGISKDTCLLLAGPLSDWATCPMSNRCTLSFFKCGACIRRWKCRMSHTS